MIKNVKHDDGLEEVKKKLNEVINVLVWENPTAKVEEVAKQHLTRYDRSMTKVRDELKSTLVEVKTALNSISTANENTEGCREDVVNFIEKTESGISNYKKQIENTLSDFNKELNNSFKEQDNNLDKKIKSFEEKFDMLKSNIETISDNLQNKIKQFITFYAQVGLHIKEMCDGKK
jgi:chromosome segregation ATPase